MDGMQSTVYENKALLLGDNFYEGGSINVPNGTEIKPGAFLKRDSGHAFLPVTDTGTETPSAVLITGVKNDSGSPKVFGIRPCIAGRLRADLVHVNDVPATPEQIDLIRKIGIVPIYANDVSRLDNM